MRLKIVAILLIISLFTLVSCGKNEDTTQGDQNDSSVADITNDSEELSDSEESTDNGSQDSEIRLPKDEF